MSGKERRTSPRKECAVPLRFRVVNNGHNAQAEDIEDRYGTMVAKASIYAATLEGEVLNLSERGLYFRSRETVCRGELLEIYLTLPRELTGRGPEQVRCSARVVHVEDGADEQGARGIGAFVERFEPMIAARNWAN